jgi:hypothetical protein
MHNATAVNKPSATAGPGPKARYPKKAATAEIPTITSLRPRVDMIVDCVSRNV